MLITTKIAAAAKMDSWSSLLVNLQRKKVGNL